MNVNYVYGIIFLFLTSLFSAVSFSASAKNYYVAANGNNNAPTNNAVNFFIIRMFLGIKLSLL